MSGTSEVPWNDFLRAAGWRVDFVRPARAAGADTTRLEARVRDLPGLTDKMQRIRSGLLTGR